MRVVVTGGAGFIGSHVVQALAERDEVKRITIVDDYSTGNRETVLRLQRGFGKLTDYIAATSPESGKIDEVTRDITRGVATWGAHSVVHLAATVSVPRSWVDPAICYNTNIIGTHKVVQSAPPHVVFASSAAVYGNVGGLMKEDVELAPTSPYGASKLAAEAILSANRTMVKCNVYRLFNVYGPGQAVHGYASVIPRFMDCLLRQEPITVYGDDVLATRDYVYVKDVAQIMADAAIKGAGPNPIYPMNLGTGEPTTINRLIKTLFDITGVVVPVVHEPARPGDIYHSHADVHRLHSWHTNPTPTPLVDGLAETWDTFRKTLGGRVDG